MHIEIDHERGVRPPGLECCNWDPEFTQCVFAWLTRQHEQGKRVPAGEGFHILAEGQRALIAAVEEILGESQEELTITLRVKGKPAEEEKGK